MNRLRQLGECRTGSALVEFALVAPVFLAMLLGIIEVSRVFWIKQSLDEVAYSTARCMSVSVACDTEAAQKTYAVNRARGYRIGITASAVVPTTGTTCKGIADSNSVTVTKNIGSALGGLVPSMPSTLTARACFPNLS